METQCSLPSQGNSGIARRFATCLVLDAGRISLTYRRQVRRHGPQAAGRGPEDGGAARGALPQSPAGDGGRRAVRRGGVFDTRDLVQVKYEMVRAVREDNVPVTQAAAAFGFSRQSYYATAAALKAGGLPALAPAKPGPKKAHKLTAQVCAFREQQLAADPACARILDWAGHLHCCRHDGRSDGWLAGCCSRSSTC